MVSNQKKRKTVTEADIEQLIENLDDGEYYPDSGFSDNDDNDENSFCNLSDADQNNTDGIQFVRNTSFPRSLHLKRYQKLRINKTTILLFHKKEKFINLMLEKTKSSNGQQINQMFPENEMSPTLFAINLDR